jgi:hypothetical protein
VTLFDHDIPSNDPLARTRAYEYYRNRSRQVLPLGWDWCEEIHSYEWGVETRFTQRKTGILHRSALVWSDHTRNGHYTAWLQGGGSDPVVVLDACDRVRHFLSEHPPPSGYALVYSRLGSSISFGPGGDYTGNSEYFHNMFQVEKSLALIEEVYGDRRARRSGLPLVFHIWEGIRILQELGASADTIAAWCLHPIVQADEDFKQVLRGGLLRRVDNPVALALAVEYRACANSYLSHMEPKVPLAGRFFDEIRLMLIADKIQNRKDFWHNPLVEDRERLSAYYEEWLRALGVSEEEAERLTRCLPRGS